MNSDSAFSDTTVQQHIDCSWQSTYSDYDVRW